MILIAEPNQFPHVLILGCGRSGTSIFSELFQTINPYRLYSEPYFDDLSHLDLSHPVAIKVPRESTRHCSDPGLSFSLDALYDTLPPPLKIFWIVRHPLDTICSLKVGISRNWGHHPRPPDWQKWLTQPLTYRCAHHWNYINGVGFEQIKSVASLVYFEDMIIDPITFAKGILAELKLAVPSEIDQWTNRVQNHFNDQFIEAETSQPYSTRNHQVKVGRYKTELSNEETSALLPLVQFTARKFGYTLP